MTFDIYSQYTQKHRCIWTLFSMLSLMLLAHPLLGAVVPKNVPPLTDWNSSTAKTLQESLADRPVLEALTTLANEIANRCEQLSGHLNKLNPDSANLPLLLEPITSEQSAIRSLFETFQYLNSLLPEEQKAGATPALTKVRNSLGPLSAVLQSKQMIRAAEELRENLNSLNQPFWDVRSESKTLVWGEPVNENSEPAQEEPAQSSGKDDKLAAIKNKLNQGKTKEVPFPEKQTLQSLSKTIIDTYHSGNTSQAVQVVPALLDIIRKEPQLLGDSQNGGFQESELGRPLDSLKRKSLAYVLRRLLSQASSQSAPLVATAYALFSAEDIVPETMRFFIAEFKRKQEEEERNKAKAAEEVVEVEKPEPKPEPEPTPKKTAKGLGNIDFKGLMEQRSKEGSASSASSENTSSGKTAETATDQPLKLEDWAIWFDSIPLLKGYVADPRIHYLMREYFLFGLTHPEKQPEIISTLGRLKGNVDFVFPALTNPEQAGFAFAVLSNMGNADSAVKVAQMLEEGQLATTLRADALLLLGKIGDERVARSVLKQLANPYLQDSAKQALLQMGEQGEEAVLAAFNAKRPAITLIALDILRETGTQKSLGRIAGQIMMYAKAISPDEVATSEEKNPFVVEMPIRNEVIRQGIEAGTKIIARLTKTEPLDFEESSESSEKQKAGQGTLSPGMSQNMTKSGSGLPNIPPEIRSLLQQKGIPLELIQRIEKEGVKAIPPALRQQIPKEMMSQIMGGTFSTEEKVVVEVDPGLEEDLFKWIVALSESAIRLYSEMTQGITGLNTYEAGRDAGEKMQPYSWADQYYTPAFTQVEDICLSVMSPDRLKVCKTYSGKVLKAMKELEKRYNRLQENKPVFDGFQEGLTGGVSENTVKEKSVATGSSKPKESKESKESKEKAEKKSKTDSIRFTPTTEKKK
ncbi:MAG: HEAT repeat domain-containing protein [Thermoguttaceae bacterium]